ncbi:MAG: hypothetical protein ACOXZU_00305 [Bacteroidales bacterium]|jgi:hypothetical protein
MVAISNDRRLAVCKNDYSLPLFKIAGWPDIIHKTPLASWSGIRLAICKKKAGMMICHSCFFYLISPGVRA